MFLIPNIGLTGTESPHVGVGRGGVRGGAQIPWLTVLQGVASWESLFFSKRTIIFSIVMTKTPFMQVNRSLISDVGGKRLDSISLYITPNCVLGGAMC